MGSASHRTFRQAIGGRTLAALLATGAGTQAFAATTATFDFESLPFGTETPFATTRNGITAQLAGPPSVDPGAFGISTNYPSPTGFAYRLMNGDFLTVGAAFGAPGAALTITFSTLLTGFTLDFGLDDVGHTTSLSFATGAGGTGSDSGVSTAGFAYPEGSVRYTGAPFDTLTLRSTAIDFQLDNLTVTAAVPEPSTVALLGAGLGLVAMGRRGRRVDAAG